MFHYALRNKNFFGEKGKQYIFCKRKKYGKKYCFFKSEIPVVLDVGCQLFRDRNYGNYETSRDVDLGQVNFIIVLAAFSS